MEEFLEDINNMLNSGEVPNLFASDEFERIIVSTRPSAKEHGISEGDRYNITLLKVGTSFPIFVYKIPSFFLA